MPDTLTAPPSAGARPTAVPLSPRSFVLLHFTIFAAGLSALARGLAADIADGLIQAPPLVLKDWAQGFYFPGKVPEVWGYCGMVAGLGAFFALAYLLTHRRFSRFQDAAGARLLASWPTFLYYLAAVLVLNLGIGSLNAEPPPWGLGPVLAVLLWGVWLLAFLSPALVPDGLGRLLLEWVLQAERRHSVFSGLGRRLSELMLRAENPRFIPAGLCAAAVLALVLEMCWMFRPFIIGPLRMINEFADIPEQTLVEGSYVDNLRFINERRVLGLSRYDPRSGPSAPATAVVRVRVPQGAFLGKLLEFDAFKFSYDGASGELSVYDRLTPLQEDALLKLGREAGALDTAKAVIRAAERNRSDDYDADELEFLKKNYFELGWQALNRWVVHHHNFVLEPVNALDLGRPASEVQAQYGLLNAYLMKWVLRATGGVTYQNYFRAWFSFYPLYYILFTLFLWLAFKDWRYVAAALFPTFGLLNKIGFDFLFLGPGLNPQRHFLDVAIAACLLVFARTRKPAWIYSGFALALVGIVNCREFGLFAFLALAAVAVVVLLEEPRYAEVLDVRALLAFAAAGLVAWKLGKSENPLVGYYMRGFLGFPLPHGFIALWALCVIAMYAVFIGARERAGDLKLPALFLGLYLQGIFLYFVWGGTGFHLLNLSGIAILTGMLFAGILLRTPSLKRFEGLALAALIAAGALLYDSGVRNYVRTKKVYSSVFEYHKVYQWNLDRASFLSTMDPRPFEDAVALVRRYSPGPGIYLVSKYDNFLPFLAGRYSSMPFFDVPWYLMSDKEIEDCASAIRRGRPEYLFVDSDMERSRNGDIFRGDLPWKPGINPFQDVNIPQVWGRGWKGPGAALFPGGESLLRVKRLNLLRKVFDGVAADYEPVERGGLITVYRRKAA